MRPGASRRRARRQVCRVRDARRVQQQRRGILSFAFCFLLQHAHAGTRLDRPPGPPLASLLSSAPCLRGRPGLPTKQQQRQQERERGRRHHHPRRADVQSAHKPTRAQPSGWRASQAVAQERAGRQARHNASRTRYIPSPTAHEDTQAPCRAHPRTRQRQLLLSHARSPASPPGPRPLGAPPNCSAKPRRHQHFRTHPGGDAQGPQEPPPPPPPPRPPPPPPPPPSTKTRRDDDDDADSGSVHDKGFLHGHPPRHDAASPPPAAAGGLAGAFGSALATHSLSSAAERCVCSPPASAGACGLPGVAGGGSGAAFPGADAAAAAAGCCCGAAGAAAAAAALPGPPACFCLCCGGGGRSCASLAAVAAAGAAGAGAGRVALVAERGEGPAAPGGAFGGASSPSYPCCQASSMERSDATSAWKVGRCLGSWCRQLRTGGGRTGAAQEGPRANQAVTAAAMTSSERCLIRR